MFSGRRIFIAREMPVPIVLHDPKQCNCISRNECHYELFRQYCKMTNCIIYMIGTFERHDPTGSIRYRLRLTKPQASIRNATKMPLGILHRTADEHTYNLL